MMRSPTSPPRQAGPLSTYLALLNKSSRTHPSDRSYVTVVTLVDG